MKSKTPYLFTMDNKLATSLTATRLPVEVTVINVHDPVIILSYRPLASALRPPTNRSTG